MGIKNVYERFTWFDNEVRLEKYPNATFLASQFEISRKTAQRDIDFMRDRLGCPLEYQPSKKGYHYVDNTFAIPLTYLSVEELTSLLIAKKILRDISGGNVGGEISTILNRITNILSKYSKTEDLIEDAISIQSIEFLPAPEEIFKIVLEGLLKRKRLTITYHSPESEEENKRKIDPYHLFNYRGTWHLIAYCHVRKGIRDFALGRITEAKISDEGFKKVVEFNKENYFSSSFGIYKGGPTQRVTLRFSPVKSRWIKGQVWHKDQEIRILKDGSLEISFPVSDLTEIKMEVLRHGDSVEVIKPKALRDLIREEAENLLMIY